VRANGGDGDDEAKIGSWKLANVSMKFVCDRLWAMLRADCDVCTGLEGDNGKN